VQHTTNFILIFFKFKQTLFIFTKFPVKKRKCCENFKIMRKLIIYFFNFNHILKFKNFRM